MRYIKFLLFSCVVFQDTVYSKPDACEKIIIEAQLSRDFPILQKMTEVLHRSPKVKNLLGELLDHNKQPIVVKLYEETDLCAYVPDEHSIVFNSGHLSEIKDSPGHILGSFIWELLNAKSMLEVTETSDSFRILGYFPEAYAYFSETEEYLAVKGTPELIKDVYVNSSDILGPYNDQFVEKVCENAFHYESLSDYIKTARKNNPYYSAGSHFNAYILDFYSFFEDIPKSFLYPSTKSLSENEYRNFFWTEERLQEEKIIGFCFKKDEIWTMHINDLEQNEWRVVLEGLSGCILENEKYLNDLENEAIVTAQEEAEVFQKIKAFKDFFGNSKK